MRRLGVVVFVVLALTPGVAAAADPADPGQTTSGTVTVVEKLFGALPSAWQSCTT